MSHEPDPDDNVRRIVVFFDMCSSTTLLEDLIASGNLRRWRNLHIALKKFLQAEAKRLPFELYKFQGDGWILLFTPEATDGKRLLNFLRRLCEKYASLVARRLNPVLTGGDDGTGLTMGIDAGPLVRIKMNRQIEYVGRSLNVAARLQAAVKEGDPRPAGKLLLSKPTFHALGLGRANHYLAKEVVRSLRNISNGERYRAMKITVHRNRQK